MRNLLKTNAKIIHICDPNDPNIILFTFYGIKYFSKKFSCSINSVNKSINLGYIYIPTIYFEKGLLTPKELEDDQPLNTKVEIDTTENKLANKATCKETLLHTKVLIKIVERENKKRKNKKKKD
uniref:Uncharacterized protein n=1 Tax=Candida saraburiensis TaxID=694444 RepID=S5U3Q1_9ASCO|nr:hypothetical protein [Candida saraburiensis]AGS44043.1 hypothetical protein [Candida saraburiensis]